MEHEGQLFCAGCLHRRVTETAATSTLPGKWMVRFRTRVALALSLLLLWVLFYGFGSVLLRIPAEVHDGTVWSRLKLEGNEPSE